MTWFWWIIIILYIAGIFWYAKKRFDDDTDDDFLDAAVDSVLVVFWPLTLLLDWYFDVKY